MTVNSSGDITNERPNCYLEIDYAIDLGKKANLILTAREDHHHSSANFRREGPAIHFDLEGYDILFGAPTTCRPSALSLRIASGAVPRSGALANRPSYRHSTERGATSSARKPKLAWRPSVAMRIDSSLGPG